MLSPAAVLCSRNASVEACPITHLLDRGGFGFMMSCGGSRGRIGLMLLLTGFWRSV